MQTPEQALMMYENPRVIFVDGTHGLTGYKYFLLTIVVVDKHGCLLCGGWAISSRDNEKTWYLFGSNLRQHALDAKVEVLMSDDANGAWNALSRVWPLKHKLLCHWHIKQAVRKRFIGKKSTIQVSTPGVIVVS